ncbi:MAG: hypothetical protein IJT44_00105 [Clostridia bacterium]|nr:hypothetical protein [Clostridia bacterium]
MAVTMVAGDRVNEYIGKSTDEKPVIGVPNASSFYEMDTMDLYLFDKEPDAVTGTWIKQG